MPSLLKFIDLWLYPLLVFMGSLVVLLALRALLLGMLRRMDSRSIRHIPETIHSVIRLPSILWCAIVSIGIGLAIAELPVRYEQKIGLVLQVLVIASVTFTGANVTGAIVRRYLQQGELQLPATGLANGIIKGTIFIVGLLIVLSTAGVSIAPMLTAFGVGGLAVALALQDTLSNLFAGMHILLERSVRIGDFVKLESGQEGYVDDITWRTTRIRMLPDNMVIIPNSVLAKSIITNYHLPTRHMAVLIPVSVSYASDPSRIERLLVDIAVNAVGEVEGLLGEPAPFVRFIPGFGSSSLDFTLICHIAEFVDQYLVQHELRKRIFAVFRAEGIEIPFPHRTVYVREDTLWNTSHSHLSSGNAPSS